jgi:hypothetical protein
MSQTGSSAAGLSDPTDSGYSEPPTTGWVGWIVFAGTMMLLISFFHIIEGFVAILDPDYYLVTKGGLTVHLDYTAWGWTHLLGGVLIGCAGLGLFLGQMWARVLGVAMAGVSALLNFAFIAAYPFWCVTVIALDVFVILALTVHGREIKSY